MLSSNLRSRDTEHVGFYQPDTVALRALGFLSTQHDQFDRFLAAAGVSPAELRQTPVARRHLSAILDFLIADEKLLTGFSRAVSLPPEAAYEARRLVDRALQRPLAPAAKGVS